MRLPGCFWNPNPSQPRYFFLETMRELPATLLLGPTGFDTLATYLWRVYEAGYFGRAAIPGLLLIFTSIIVLLIMLYTEDIAEGSN